MKPSSLLGLSAIVISGQFAVAQDEAAPQQRQRNSLIEEVVVTAQKREQSAEDVGIAISAFSDDTLKALGVTDTADLTNLVAGFSYTDSGFSIPVYTLRGVGFNEISQTATSAVGVYIDEVNIPFPVMTKGANLDLERVEVLKGPQGTLYGRNTTGGAVNYISKKPGEEFEAGVSAAYQKYGQSDLEAYVSGPLSDTLGARFALRDIRSSEGWQYDYTRPGAELGEVDKQSARFMLVWDASDDVIVQWSVDGWRDRSEPQSPQYYKFKNFSALPAAEASENVQNHPTAPEDDARATAYNPERELGLNQDYIATSVRTDWQFSESTTFTSILALQRFDGNDSYNNDGLNVSDLDYDTATDTTAWNAEFRFSGFAFDDSVQWVAGYFYSGDELEDTRLTYPTESSGGYGGIFVRQVDLYSKQDAESHALFGQAEWQASEEFKYTLGLRYTKDSRDYDACTRDADGTTASLFQAVGALQRAGLGDVFTLLTSDEVSQVGQVVAGLLPVTALSEPIGQVLVAAADAGLLDLTGELSGGPGVGDCVTLNSETNESGLVRGGLDEDNISGRVAVDWTPSDAMLFYASYSIGYKAGSYPSLLSATDAQYTPVTQERIEAFELGMKAQWFDGLLKVNSSLFRYNYEDKQLFTVFKDPIFGAIQRLDNVPESIVQGLELEVQAAPFDGLYTSIGFSLLDTEVVDYVGIDINGDDQDFSGNELDYASPMEVTAVVNYEWPVLNDYSVNFGLDGKYSDAAQGDLSNDPVTVRPSYFILNARLSFSPYEGPWNIQGYVRNLTDEVYFNSSQFQPDVFVRYTGKPRIYGVRLDYEF